MAETQMYTMSSDEMSPKGKSTETESRWVVVRGWGRGQEAGEGEGRGEKGRE